MAHKLPSKDYTLMLEIKYIVQSWQDLSYSDKDALNKIELILKDRTK